MGHRQFARTKKSRPHRTHQSCAWSRTRGMDVGAKNISPVRACAIDAPSPNHQTWPHHKSWRPPNVTTHRICRGETFFARPCAIHTQSPGHQQSPRPISWRRPKLTTRRMCRGEIFFARPCATHSQSPNHQTWPHHKSWCAPQIAPCITYVRAKNISPLRVPSMSIRPTIKHRRTPNRGARPM